MLGIRADYPDLLRLQSSASGVKAFKVSKVLEKDLPVEN